MCMPLSGHWLARCGRLLLVLTASGVAHAAPPANNVSGVVELFTSQGCSSCPPADRLLTMMATDPNIIALSFAVDYWDYIGWKDTLAAPEFTARQKAYATARGDERVFTPEAIIDGVADSVGSDKGQIDQALQNGKEQGGVLSVPLHLSEASGVLQIDIGGSSGETAHAGIYVLRVAKSRT